jgi:hypothetical protein
MTAARRLAAILAVDFIGYPRLVGEDQAGTTNAVREHCEAQDFPDTLALRCFARTHR